VNEFNKAAKAKNLEVVKVERFDRNDTSVLALVLKIMSAKPDAVLVAGSGTPGVLPQATLREKGYKGPIYQTTGVTNNDFIRVGGKNVEGALVASAPFMVADDIPQNHPAKAAAMNFKKKYETAYGANTATGFASYAWDAGLLLEAAMVKAMATTTPGTVEFRTAVRDALENTKNFRTSNGINNMSATDHSGYTEDAAVLVTVKDGRWRLAAD
jgi:branched-chain amino acid transport system substrate-binding protein